MAPLNGWAPMAERLRVRALTFIAALRYDPIHAPCVLDGSVIGEDLCACVWQILVPTLRPSDVEVMNNLGSRMRQAICNA